MSFLDRLQNIDRRILYLLIAAVIATPLLLRPARHPSVVMPEVHNAFNTLEQVPEDKLVIISVVYSAGTVAENGPQTEVIMRQLFMRHIKFGVLSWDPVGVKLSYDTAAKLAKEYHAEYGRDWVDFGYRPGPIYAVISGMAEDFRKVIDHDMFGTKLSKIPMLKNVRNHRQIGAVVEITPSGTLGTWIAYFNMPYHIPLVFCPTAVMAAEAYPFLDSKQVAGMLNGVIGAAQYEVLLGRGETRTYAAAASWALSAAHIFIILLIIVGNIGYVASKRAARGGRPQ
jgi:hypothetical protein